MSHRTRALVTLGALVALVAFADTADAAKKKKKKAPAPVAAAVAEDAPPFDRDAAVNALTSVDLQKCRATNAPKGDGHVMITFEPAGGASNATVDKGPWLGTPTAKCIANQYKKAKVPAFKGDPVTVGKIFRFE